MTEDRRAPALKIYTEAEIELLLNGDRKEVDRLLILGINNIAGVLIPHTAKEEKVMEVLGSPETIRIRSEWIDAQVAVMKTRTEFWNDMRTELGKHTLRGLLIVTGAVFLYYWTGHVVMK